MTAMGDLLVYGTAACGKLRFSCASMKLTVEEVRLRHRLSPIATVALGRLLIGVALAIPWLAEREVLTFYMETKGPLGRVVAQSRGDFTVRGYVSNPNVETTLKSRRKFDLASVVKGGTLKVIRDLRLKYPIVSQVPIKSGEIAQDIAYYCTVSEQIPTAMALGVLLGKDGVMNAGGYAVQVIDKSLSEDLIERLEERVEKLGAITESLTSGMGPVEIIEFILEDEMVDYRKRKIGFRCDCDREKAFESILVLPLEEIEQMRNEGFGEVTCKWCSTRYLFYSEDLKKAFSEKRARSGLT